MGKRKPQKSDLDYIIKDTLVKELLKKKVLPTKEVIDELFKKKYLKDDLVPKITDYLYRKSVNFCSLGGKGAFMDKLYSLIYKEPLKRTLYGMINSDIPEEILQDLNPWSCVYLFAGIWAKKSTPILRKKFTKPKLNFQNVYGIIEDCIKEGKKKIKSVHNNMYEKRIYSSFLKTVPHEKEVKQNLQEFFEKHYNKQLNLF